MYLFVLSLHNLLRWVVLISAVYSLVLLLPGLSGTRAWTRNQDRATVIYSGLMQLQLVVGLALYLGVSPYMRGILDNFGAAMKDDTERFFAVEHITGMILAVVFAFLARALSKRVPDTGAAGGAAGPAIVGGAAVGGTALAGGNVGAGGPVTASSAVGSGARRKYRVASLWTVLSLLTVLAFIPWWRPLLRV